MIITSKTNAKIVLLKKLLSDKKYRIQHELYCIEGEKLVREAKNRKKCIKSLFVKQSKADKFDFLHEFEVFLVEDSIFEEISSTQTSQGIVAVLQLPKTTKNSPIGNALVLENLQDSGNVGTLLRTAVATGFCDVYLVNCADVYSMKVIRSAMSAHFLLNLHICDSIFDAFECTKNCQILCADMNGQNIFEYRQCDSANCRQIALVLGNEGNGVSQFAKENSAKTISLPMKNNLESLNVAVAGSILMYLLTEKH